MQEKLLLLLHIQDELIKIEEDYTNLDDVEEHRIEKTSIDAWSDYTRKEMKESSITEGFSLGFFSL